LDFSALMAIEIWISVQLSKVDSKKLREKFCLILATTYKTDYDD